MLYHVSLFIPGILAQSLHTRKYQMVFECVSSSRNMLTINSTNGKALEWNVAIASECLTLYFNPIPGGFASQ